MNDDAQTSRPGDEKRAAEADALSNWWSKLERDAPDLVFRFNQAAVEITGACLQVDEDKVISPADDDPEPADEEWDAVGDDIFDDLFDLNLDEPPILRRGSKTTPRETLTPPRRLDLWLTREAHALSRAFEVVLGREAQRPLPTRAPFAFYRGPEGARYQWRYRSDGGLEPTAEAADVPLREALLSSRYSDEIALQAVDIPDLPEDILVLCPPPLRQLDAHTLRRFWPQHFITRRVVWFELGSGRPGARDCRLFLRGQFPDQAVHFVVLDLLRMERHAQHSDHQSAMLSVLQQVSQHWEGDFKPWIHLAP